MQTEIQKLEEKKRTNKQNRALHLYFTMLAEELNNAGYDMRKTLKPEVEISWNAGTIKNFLWRPIQTAQLGKESTTNLTTKEIDVIYNTLNRHLNEKFGIHLEFPSQEQLIILK